LARAVVPVVAVLKFALVPPRTGMLRIPRDWYIRSTIPLLRATSLFVTLVVLS
jgi:hypothetical protein